MVTISLLHLDSGACRFDVACYWNSPKPVVKNKPGNAHGRTGKPQRQMA